MFVLQALLHVHLQQSHLLPVQDPAGACRLAATTLRLRLTVLLLMVLLLLLQGQPVHGLLTDRRIILRESSGSCGFPLNLCCICFKVCCSIALISPGSRCCGIRAAMYCCFAMRALQLPCSAPDVCPMHTTCMYK
jgi:hypothetical protein